jgi:hypothetical protein
VHPWPRARIGPGSLQEIHPRVGLDDPLVVVAHDGGRAVAHAELPDMPGYFYNRGVEQPEQPDWNLVARMLVAVSIYEWARPDLRR